MRKLISSLLPASAKKLLKRLLGRGTSSTSNRLSTDGTEQYLDIYWDEKFANLLETWGEENTWIEVKMLFFECNGKVLDVACGTGRVMEILKSIPKLDLYGCDISDLLLARGIKKGIPKDRLILGDATKMTFENNAFDYSYSIGSLEHFTEEGISQCIGECKRVSSKSSFHMIPVSRNDLNNGWIAPHQAYFNNSLEWWLDKFRAHFPEVTAVRSRWEDDWSVGYWILCRTT